MAIRVLVVDDERLIADTLAKILSIAGYEAATAYDGESAVAKVEVFHPSLVISDVVMPKLDGIQAAMAIHKNHPECLIVLISGQASTTDLVEEARRKGFIFEVLLKPIHPADLLKRIQLLLPASA